MLVSDLIEETRRLLFGGQREERNKLNGAINSSVTSLAVSYPLSQITRGAKLSIDLEDIYVWDASGLTVSPIDRGQWGSVADSHSNSAIINVNPKFSNWDIFNALNDEIVSLSSPLNGLYQVQTVELTYNPVITGYDYSDTGLISILEVRYGVYGPSRELPISRNWEYSSNLSPEFSSSAIFVRDAIPGHPVLVKGKFAFNQLAASMTADSSTIGIADTALDILSLGAAWKLTSRMELTRNYTSAQSDTRRAAEVPAGAELGASRELGRLHDLRVREEAARLDAKYPSRMDRFPYKASYV